MPLEDHPTDPDKYVYKSRQYQIDCPTCEYHRQRAQIWRDEAYKLSGHPLPERDPVGKIAQFTDGIWREVTDGSAGVPLYTTPPQRTWVGLTVDELITLEQKHMRHEDLSRAIEAKLKEKNK